jgi:prolipoprotein diacylglyceryltransferase
METLAYSAGFAIYARDCRRRGDIVDSSARSSVLVAAILGAAAGSKLLAWLEDPAALMANVASWQMWLGAKTIVGGLLGGTLAVEWTKARLGITSRTGDLFAVPISIGIAIGRVGCFFGGLADRTYGTPTSLPWGVDFGDGIARHPTQLYEGAFLVALAWELTRFRRMPHREGDVFRVFMLSYMTWRLCIDFLKPGIPFLGLTAIQWACFAALLCYARDAVRIFARPRVAAHG